MTTIEDIKTKLREIIELSDKATPGPWRHETSRAYCTDDQVTHNVVGPPSDYMYLREKEDSIFIATSRNLTPKMAKALLGVIGWLELYAIPTGEAQAQLETIRREWEGQA